MERHIEHDSGKCRVERQGRVRRFYFDGKLKSISRYPKDSGRQINYDEDGNIEAELIFNRNGKIIRSVNYRKDGSFYETHYLYNGSVVIEDYSKDGSLQGVAYCTKDDVCYVFEQKSKNK